MPVPSLRTWSSGELGTASELNSNIRDAGNFLLFPPYLLVTLSANAAVGSGAWTLVNWNLEMVNTDHMHSTSTNPSRIIATTAGRYDVQVCGLFSAPGTAAKDLRAIQVRLNSAGLTTIGTELVSSSEVSANSTTTNTGVLTNVWPYLHSGDYIEVFVWSTVAVNLMGQPPGDFQTFLSAQWIGVN